MKFIAVGDKIYVASEAPLKESDHKTPAGLLYRVETAVDMGTHEALSRVLNDIARAEGRQWRNRMLAAGLAAGAGYAVAESVIGALFGKG